MACGSTVPLVLCCWAVQRPVGLRRSPLVSSFPLRLPLACWSRAFVCPPLVFAMLVCCIAMCVALLRRAGRARVRRAAAAVSDGEAADVARCGAARRSIRSVAIRCTPRLAAQGMEPEAIPIIASEVSSCVHIDRCDCAMERVDAWRVVVTSGGDGLAVTAANDGDQRGTVGHHCEDTSETINRSHGTQRDHGAKRCELRTKKNTTTTTTVRARRSAQRGVTEARHRRRHGQLRSEGRPD